MSDNSWYEKGELPTVGTPCIHKTYGKGFVIAKHYFDDEVIIFANHKDCGELHYANSTELIPIKTERELAIEDLVRIAESAAAKMTNQTYIDSKSMQDSYKIAVISAIYDAGYRKNESL